MYLAGFIGAALIAQVGVSTQVAPLDQLERHVKLLRVHHQRLEMQLKDVGKRIARLKRQGSGVGRDFQLNKNLRSSQALAKKLTLLARKRRALEEAVLRQYDLAIKRERRPAVLRSLKQRRAKIAASRARLPSKIVVNQSSDPLDTREDLQEKADLLSDSREKVKRQLKQVEVRLARLEQRAKLLRHGQAAEDTMFVENVPRRVGQSRTTLQSANPGINGAQEGRNSSDPSDPNLGAPTSFDGAPGNLAAPTGGNVTPGVNSGSVTLRDVIDPATFRQLGLNNAGGGNIQDQIAALKRAREKLSNLAKELNTKAETLRQSAERR